MAPVIFGEVGRISTCEDYAYALLSEPFPIWVSTSWAGLAGFEPTAVRFGGGRSTN